MYLAGLVLPDLLHYCASGLGDDAEQLKLLCSSLKAWDGNADLHGGVGLMHFQNVMQVLLANDDVWRVKFDPLDPQRTPRGLNIEQPKVAEALHKAMLASAAETAAAGLKADSLWGDVQQTSSAGKRTPIHGGPSHLGAYNAMQSVPGEGGKREVGSGQRQ